jgi:hypothetical protein
MTKSLGYKSSVFLCKEKRAVARRATRKPTQLEKEHEMAEEITLAKACMDYFSPKMTTAEYRELSHEDKEELRKDFIHEGFNIAPLKPPAETES